MFTLGTGGSTPFIDGADFLKDRLQAFVAIIPVALSKNATQTMPLARIFRPY
jgi:hypothetical protein